MAEINDLDTTAANNTARFPENMAPSAVNNGARELESIIARWYKDTNGSVATTGSSNAYVMAANQTLTAYYDGLLLAFEANHTCTGAATLNVDSLGAKTIKKNYDSDLASGDLESGAKYIVVYDSTNDVFQLLTALANPPATIGADNNFTADQTIVSTNAGATEGPALDLYRNSASPAASDIIGALRFKGEDSASNKETYAKINAVIDDATSGSEDATLDIATVVAGTLADRLHVAAGVFANGNSDPGAGKLDMDGLLISGSNVEATSLDTEQATTSGTEFDFTAPFATVTRAIIMFDGVSPDGTTDDIIIQLGTSSSPETSGYSGTRNLFNEAGASWGGSGIEINRSNSAANAFVGQVDLSLMDSANNTWIATGTFAGDNQGNLVVTAGKKSLAGALDLIRVTLSGTPTDAFDAGAVNVRWYGYD